MVGTYDNKDLVYAFSALNLADGKLTTRLLEKASDLKRKEGKSKTRHMQEGFARHLRDIGRAYPPLQYPRVVVIIDNAPWHRGALISEALANHPHLELYRLPSYSPNLNRIERFWKILRRRATHNRLFGSMAELRKSLRNSISYYQTLRHKVLSLVGA